MLLESNFQATDGDESGRSENEDLINMEVTDEFNEDLVEYVKEKRKELKGRDFANNTALLKQKFEEIKLIDSKGQQLPWIEVISITASEPLNLVKVDDDLQREIAIYKQTLSNFEKAIEKFVELNVKFKRPNDYYAEMVKTDEHMTNIKKVLLSEKKQKEDREKRLKNTQMRIYAKKIQTDTIIKRQKKKSEDLAVINQWKKKRERSGGEKSNFPSELLDPENPDRRKLLSKSTYKELLPLKSKKRLQKDRNYSSKHKGQQSKTKNNSKRKKFN